MFGEFQAFLLKTNALALAVGVIIGVALGDVVHSLVNDIIMPPIGVLLGNVDFANFKIVLKTDADPQVAIRYGTFINTIITFVIVAFVVFMIARLLIKEPPPVEVKTCTFCKEPNATDATKCKACTSTI